MTATDTATAPVTAPGGIVRPIDPAVVAQLRRRDDAGRVPVPTVEQQGGSPLRCCLRAGRPGERVLLVSYAPLRRWAAARGVDPGAYDEVGPVFVHAEPCPGPAGTGWPDDFRGSPRVLRGYAADGHIVGGILVGAGDEPEGAVARLLADPTVAVVHARALEFGCFTFAVERAG